MAAQNKTPQNLSPDLKQIYDRVMNTPAKGSATPPAPPATPGIPDVKPAVPPPPPATSFSSNPVTAPQSPMENVPAPFLTSTPPRPPVESIGVKTFALGNDKKEEKETAKPVGNKMGISKPVIIILGVVFFLAWSFFWFVFFFNPFA